MPGPGGVFASGGPEPLPIAIRLETPGDEPGVRRVHAAAFPGPEEAAIVDEIRQLAPAGWQSIVAVDRSGDIVGHVLLSPCPVEDDHGNRVGEVLALRPIGVLPEMQYRGVGSALITAAVSLAIARGVPALVLLGQPAYYPRFGFMPARSCGLQPPADAWPDAAWMARLLPAWQDGLRGRVRYPRAFEPLA
ncbi:MAG: GNAT family N-acetyltransferase [Candidatus Limnocylindrales bacterium]